MKNSILLGCVLLSALAALTLVACGGGSIGGPSGPPVVESVSITASPTTIAPGQTSTITANVVCTGACSGTPSNEVILEFTGGSTDQISMSGLSMYSGQSVTLTAASSITKSATVTIAPCSAVYLSTLCGTAITIKIDPPATSSSSAVIDLINERRPGYPDRRVTVCKFYESDCSTSLAFGPDGTDESRDLPK